MTSSRRHPINCRRALVVALALGGAALAAEQAHPALAAEQGSYQPPNMREFLLIGTEDGDGDGDGIEETRILRYRSTAGDRVFSMTTGGRLWAWSLETLGEGAGGDPGGGYVIRDSDCDGTFDERYGLDEEFQVPECLK